MQIPSYMGSTWEGTLKRHGQNLLTQKKKKKKQTDLGFNFGLMSCDLELVLSGPHGICKMGAVLVPVSLGVAGTQQMLVSYPLPLAGNGNSDIEGKERTGRSVKLWGERALGEGP